MKTLKFVRSLLSLLLAFSLVFSSVSAEEILEAENNPPDIEVSMLTTGIRINLSNVQSSDIEDITYDGSSVLDYLALGIDDGSILYNQIDEKNIELDIPLPENSDFLTEDVAPLFGLHLSSGEELYIPISFIQNSVSKRCPICVAVIVRAVWSGGRWIVKKIITTGVSRGAITGLSSLSYASRYGIKSYKILKKKVKGKGLEVHHLVEKRFAGLFNVKSNNMLSIVLTKAEHRIFTDAWRKAIPYRSGTRNATIGQIAKVAKKIYKNYPDILKALRIR